MSKTLAFSVVLACALAVGPFAAMYAEARGGGGAASGGGGAPAGAPSGAGPAGPAGGDSGNTSAPSGSGSPSASPGVGNPSTSPAASPRMTSGAVGTTVISPSASPAGRQTVTGQVTSIDASKGTFTMTTVEAGTLHLQAAPSAVAGVKRGDTIVVEIVTAPAR
jgi:hypothetical protein